MHFCSSTLFKDSHLKALLHPRCISRRGTVFVYGNLAILRVRVISIYFHPGFLSFSCYHGFWLKLFHYLTIDFDKYFCNLECFRLCWTFQYKTKRSQSITDERGPLRLLLYLLFTHKKCYIRYFFIICRFKLFINYFIPSQVKRLSSTHWCMTKKKKKIQTLWKLIAWLAPVPQISN